MQSYGAFDVDGLLRRGSYDEGKLSAVTYLLDRHDMRVMLLTGTSVMRNATLRHYLVSRLLPSIYEMGTVIADHRPDGSVDRVYRLVDVIGNSDLICAQDAIQRLVQDFSRDGKRAVLHDTFDGRAHFLADRRHIFTLESSHEIGPQMARYVLDKIDSETRELIDGGRIKLISSSRAVDLQPTGIDKGVAFLHLREELGLSDVPVLAAGDSAHSDVAFMQYAFPACPANADDETKRFVVERGGIASEYAYEDGVLDIIDRWGRRQ